MKTTEYRIDSYSVEIFSSDRSEYGGSSVETPAECTTDAVPMHGKSGSIRLVLAPLSVAVYAHRD